MALPQRSLRIARSSLPALRTISRAATASSRLSTPLPLQPHARTQRRSFLKEATSAPTPTPTPTKPPNRSASKLYPTAAAAVADLQPGITLLSAGFGLCGIAQTLIAAIAARGPASLHSLTAVSNNAGAGTHGLALLAQTGQLTRLILSYLGANKDLEKQYLNGDIAVELCPQGTIAERLRAGGAGVPAFYTATGVGTLVQAGGIPVRLAAGGKEVVEAGRARETRAFAGRDYLLEEAITGDVAILRAWRVDAAGNCQFRGTTKTFAPLMAKAARLAIVEAEEVVPLGGIAPDQVHLPGIYVDRICPATEGKAVEVRKVREVGGSREVEGTRARIARRTAKELKRGFYVNLGVGIPTLAPSFLEEDAGVWIQSENGLLGMVSLFLGVSRRIADFEVGTVSDRG